MSLPGAPVPVGENLKPRPLPDSLPVPKLPVSSLPDSLPAKPTLQKESVKEDEAPAAENEPMPEIKELPVAEVGDGEYMLVEDNDQSAEIIVEDQEMEKEDPTGDEGARKNE